MLGIVVSAPCYGGVSVFVVAFAVYGDIFAITKTVAVFATEIGLL